MLSLDLKVCMYLKKFYIFMGGLGFLAGVAADEAAAVFAFVPLRVYSLYRSAAAGSNPLII